MGAISFLKNLLSAGEPPLQAMEPRCVRYEWFTMRLPPGWQFTRAGNRGFAVSGPGGFMSEVTFWHVRGFKIAEFDKHRKVIVQIMQRCVESRSAKESALGLPAGVLWMEASDVQAKNHVLRIALFNSRPRNQDPLPPPILQVTVKVTGSSPGSDAEPLDQVRSALRGIEWN
jgi:hypothetical protein